MHRPTSVVKSSAPLWALLFVFGLGAPRAAHAAPLSVSIGPQLVDMPIRPGASAEDAFSFSNDSDTPLAVTVSVVDFVADEAGRAVKKPAGTEPTSVARFIRISPVRARVEPHQRVYFRYKVKAPEEFTQLQGIVAFEAVPQVAGSAGKARMVLVPVLGVPFYLENPAARPGTLKVDDLSVTRDGGNLKLSLRVTNEGQRNIRPTGFVRVRSAEGGFDTSYPFNDGREAVLPGAARVWTLTLGPVPGGALSIGVRFSNAPRTVFEKTLELPAAGH